jgi:putative transposase
LSVVGAEGRSELVGDLDELVREGARGMLAVALEEEVAAYVAAHAGEVDEHGHRLVRRNGHARERVPTTGAGQVPVAAPARGGPADRSDHRREGAVRQRDPAAVVPQELKGGRGAAVAVPARDELG